MNIRTVFFTICILTSFMLWPQAGQDVELETETGRLSGTLTIPEGETRVPVVLIIAGSGPTDRNGNNPMMTNNSLQLLAQGLASEGIASLRFDKRGVAGSVGAATKEEELRFETYIKDVVDWAKQLRKDSRFDELILLGHSEGSLIGMVAAQQIDADKFISLAGVGRPAADVLREQLSSQSPAITAITDPILDTLETGRTVKGVNPMLNSLFRPSVQPYLISWFKYDPAKEIAKLRCPVLLVQGTTDIQVKVADADMLAEANGKAEKVVMEGMNHVLKTAPEDRMANVLIYNDPTLPLHDGLLEVLVSFIRK